MDLVLMVYGLFWLIVGELIFQKQELLQYNQGLSGSQFLKLLNRQFVDW